MKPKDLDILWRRAKPAIFSAHLGDRLLGASLYVYPMKRGGGFMVILWAAGRDPINSATADCIAAGGRCRNRTEDGAIMEGMRLLLKVHRAEP
jgi:hypothetical protein